MKCPKCQSKSSVKSDYMKGNQYYICKACSYNYTV
jgi:transposase-like protein